MKYYMKDFIEVNKNQIIADISETTSNADMFTEIAMDQAIVDVIEDMEEWIAKMKDAMLPVDNTDDTAERTSEFNRDALNGRR